MAVAMTAAPSAPGVRPSTAPGQPAPGVFTADYELRLEQEQEGRSSPAVGTRGVLKKSFFLRKKPARGETHVGTGAKGGEGAGSFPAPVPRRPPAVTRFPLSAS